MLTAYLTATQNLLQNPSAPAPLYSTTGLTADINTARGQLAGESECIPFMGSIAVTAGQTIYPFSSIALTGGTAAGVLGPINVRTLWYNLGTGQQWIRPRPWPWFSFYELSNPVPGSGAPAVWAQYGQGVNGSIYLSPSPDQAYTIEADCVCLPVPLVTDNTPEAIPALWTDAVPYFAAYLALLSSQTSARTADADKMFQRYGEFVQRARRAATPSIFPTIYSQVASPVRQNQLGVSGQAAQGGG